MKKEILPISKLASEVKKEWDKNPSSWYRISGVYKGDKVTYLYHRLDDEKYLRVTVMSAEIEQKQIGDMAGVGIMETFDSDDISEKEQQIFSQTPQRPFFNLIPNQDNVILEAGFERFSTPVTERIQTIRGQRSLEKRLENALEHDMEICGLTRKEKPNYFI
jgi:hypothetical protein